MRPWLVAAALVVAGCSNIASPALTDAYEYRCFADVATGECIGGTDTLTFHWPRELLPVRVWVADDSPVRPYVTTAIDRWQHAFLYGEFRATLVADSSIADIIVLNAPSPDGGALLRHPPLHARAGQCNGETIPDIDAGTNTLTLPIRLYMYATVSEIEPGIATCYSITMTHEMGHAIGLLAHSPSDGDVMFANPVFDGISDRDRQTAVTVYHVPSTLTIAGRR